MGTGASKSLAKSHGPRGNGGDDRAPTTSSSARVIGGGGGAHAATTVGHHSPNSNGHAAANGAVVGSAATGEASSGVGLTSADKTRHGAHSPVKAAWPPGVEGGAANPLGDEDISLSSNEGDRSCFTRVDAVVGPPDSNAKYVKKRPIGKGAYGEAYIVECNANYDPSMCPLAEKQVSENRLAHPTRVGGTYVIKVMDLGSMRQQDRQYARTEIICIAHTHHFAIVKYYEHYVLDSNDETMAIVTEFADHGDLARNLSRGHDARLLAEVLTLSSPSRGPTSSGTMTIPGSSNERLGSANHSFPSHSAASPTSSYNNGHGSTVVTASSALAPVTSLQLTEKEAGMYFVQILAALHHIHRGRMIHRDIKSANLFLTSNGFIKLGDFGFSQKYESTVSSETIAGTFLGTPYYVSPEMWKGTRYGKKADVWAAGIVLYEMLMDGKRPFEAMGLTDLKRAVLDNDVTLPEYPPGAEPTTTEGGAAAAGITGDEGTTGGVRRGKFSKEIRELVMSIFQKDPKERPSTEELLRTPIMQHYLFLFQRHVQALITADDKLRSEHADGTKGPLDPSALAFADPADQELVLKGLERLNEVIHEEIQKELEGSGALRYEGAVYKGNRDGSWKERYLALDDGVLVISLSKSKSAMDGGERSRKVPLNMLKAVNRCQASDPQVQPVPEAAGDNFKPPHTFVLFMAESSSPIYFGVNTEEEVDTWMRVLMKALNVD